ncbi:MAG: DUF488 family protein [Deltaproteobacteria bacterium]
MKKRGRKGSAPVVLTIGHSTRSLEALIGLLQAHQVHRVVDVRTIPRSRHNPQFNKETLPAALRAAGIKYRHLPKLGGLRHARADSPNMAWRNASFRGFADYMQTPEFEAAIETLAGLAGKERLALMCAEAVPWRCHRSLIADALWVRGFRVEHILSGIRSQLHEPTPWARIRGKRITYPLQEPDGETASAPGARRHALRKKFRACQTAKKKKTRKKVASAARRR